MKKNIGITLGFIIVYVIFLVVLAPASLLTKGVTLPNYVQLQGLSGTLWQPKISRLVVQNLTIHNIEAKLSPLSLITLSPVVAANFGGGLDEGPEGKTTLELTSQSLQLTDTQVEFSADLVVPYLPSPVPIEAFGLVIVDVETLTMEGGKCMNAGGVVRWRKGALAAFNESVDLGEFTGQISCQNSMLTLDIAANNSLGLSFTAQVSSNGRVSGSGFVKPGASFPAKLKDLLSFIGKPDSQGRYRVRF